MKFNRRLFRCCSAGIIVWFIACIGTGLYLRPFIVLCGWSVVLLHRLLPVSIPADVYELAWPKLCVISLISWLAVAVFVAAVSHWVLVRREDRLPKLKKCAVAGSTAGFIAAVLAFGACIWASAFAEEPVDWAFSPWWRGSNWLSAFYTFAVVAFSVLRPERSKIKCIIVWLFRAVYISIILAMCDCWVASSPNEGTLFSKQTWAMTDGGTSGYVGFGYSLHYYRRLDASLHGPVVWFWFAPFEVSFALRNPELLWVW